MQRRRIQRGADSMWWTQCPDSMQPFHAQLPDGAQPEYADNSGRFIVQVIIQKRTGTIYAVHIGISASQEDITRFAPL